MAEAGRVQTRHPVRGKKMPRIEARKYRLVRRVLLRLIPRSGRGVAFTGLSALVRKSLPARERTALGSVGWYTTVVKLDLEARGEIERVPGVRSQRLRRRR